MKDADGPLLQFRLIQHLADRAWSESRRVGLSSRDWAERLYDLFMLTPPGIGRRLSEKSIELNFCRQMSALLGGPAWWFGATQKQESDAGWDISTRVPGAWVYFQLKASDRVLKSGERQFMGHHDQLLALRALAVNPLEVFYVFPTLGNTVDLATAKFDLIPNLRFLDVSVLPSSIVAPTTAAGSLRKNQMHYFKLNDDTLTVTIHSEPMEAGLLTADGLGSDIRGAVSQRARRDSSVESAERTRRYLGASRNRVAVYLPVGDSWP